MRLEIPGASLELYEDEDGIRIANYQGEPGKLPEIGSKALAICKERGKTPWIAVAIDNKEAFCFFNSVGFEPKAFLMVKE